MRILAISIILLLVAINVHAITGVHTGCVIATNNGALQDVDCDRAGDPFDNCPFTPNPEQIDRDKNGIGDACDLIIDEINIDPQEPIQGRSMIVQATLFNNRAYPMRNVVVKTEVPTLGLANNEPLDIIDAGERLTVELVVRIPECAPLRFTDVVIMAEYPYAPGQKEVFSQAVKVPVVAGGTCNQGPADDKTVVNILEIQDVDPRAGALYPFTIHNNEIESKAYVLSVQNLDWGIAEIHPGTVIVVPPGEARDGALQIWAAPGVTGRQTFMLNLQAKDDVKQVMLLANVPEANAQTQIPPAAQLFWGVIGFLVLLAVLLIIVVIVKKNMKK